MKYQINEEQQAKIDSLLNQLDEEGKTLFQDKIERLLSFNNAEVRLNKLLEKTIVEIKKLISVEKSRNKKKEKKNASVTKNNIVVSYADIINSVSANFNPIEITELINELKKIRDNKLEAYKNELAKKILELQEELENLQ